MKTKISELKNNTERISQMISLYNELAERAKEGVSKKDAEELRKTMEFLKQDILKTTLLTKEKIKEIKTKLT